jgi:hypothetical protein
VAAFSSISAKRRRSAKELRNRRWGGGASSRKQDQQLRSYREQMSVICSFAHRGIYKERFASHC